ncbi:MAG: TonB-dependent receptor [Gammaproteobacteria bacterium]
MREIMGRSILAGAILAATAVPVAAQGGGRAAGAGAIEEVMVTARRREEAVTEVPLAVTAFSADQLETKNIQNTADLVKITPGLNISGAGSVVNPFIVIRGASRALAGAGVPGVITYFNEVPMPTYGSLISTQDMDNVQVLKGPQGTLFGRNAVGGAILTYSKKPTYEFEGSALIDYAQYQTARGELVLNVPIVKDMLAVRVNALFSTSDGFTKTLHVGDYTVTNAPGGVGRIPGARIERDRDLDGYDRQGFRVSVLFEPNDRISNLTVIDTFNDEGVSNSVAAGFFSGGFPFNRPGATNPNVELIGSGVADLARGNWPVAGVWTVAQLGLQLGAPIPPLGALFGCTTSVYCNLERWSQVQQQLGLRTQAINTDATDVAQTEIFGVSNTTTFEINDKLSVKNIFGYRTTDSLSNADIDGTPMPIIDTASRVRLNQLTDELQFSGTAFQDKLDYVVGGFYYRQGPDGDGGFQGLRINVFGGLNHTQSVNYAEQESKSIYGQFDLDVSEWLLEGMKFTAGYRHTWDSTEGCASFATFAPGAYFPVGDTAPMVTEDQCRAGNFQATGIPTNFYATLPAALGGGPNATGGSIPRVDTDQGTYTLALSWEPWDGKLFYVTHRKGYRAGDYNSNFFTGTLAYLSPVQNFEGETVEDVELGAKLAFNLAGMPTTFDIALFHEDDTGFQFYESTSGVTTQAAGAAFNVPGFAAGVTLPSGGIVYNKANLTIEGLELGATVSPMEGLTIGANAAYTDISIDELTIPAAIRASFASPGDPNANALGSFTIPFVPEWQANVTVGYTYPGQVLGGTLSFNADYHYQTEFVVSQIVVPGYELVNMRFDLKDVMGKPFDISFYAKNLFDETYAYGSSSSTPSGPTGGVGVSAYIIAPPQVFGASVRWRFGAQ